MKKYLLFILTFAIIIIGGVIIFKNINNKTKENTMLTTNLLGRKALFVIAFKDFRDMEYFIPKEILTKAGIQVKTASNKKGVAIGADGGEVQIDLSISEAKAKDFEAIIFVGGPGCLENLDNEDSYRLIKETIDNERILAAICISPVILAKAGVLKNKKATVWSSPLDKNPIKILQENGAIFQDQPVVVDGRIITANGPGAAKDFAQIIIKNLK